MFIDCHTHLDAFGECLEKALDIIEREKIVTIANSMDVDSYKKIRQQGGQSKIILPCFGMHPWRSGSYDGELAELIPYIEESIMIGEIGLDYVWAADKEKYDRQREVFLFMLRESAKRNKVVTIHTKGAERDILSALEELSYHKVIIHWYSGPWDVFEKLKQLGCYFTVSVDLGYKKQAEELLRRIPPDRILLETDGPDALKWVNGEYGYPDSIKKVYERVAALLSISEGQLEERIQNNFLDLTDYVI